MAAGQTYTAGEVAEAIFQDSGSEFGGDASDSDFEDSQADNSDFQASSSSESADSEPEPEHDSYLLTRAWWNSKVAYFLDNISLPNPLNGESRSLF